MCRLILDDLRKRINACKNISLIGTFKNVGKTTTLNFVLRLLEKSCVGLTSVGRDGEETDVVTSTKKPRIFIPTGTIVATARKCLIDSSVSFLVLKATSIATPLGEVYIAKSKTCGFVELAGPSTTEQLAIVCELMKDFGAEKILVDGALSRKSIAVPEICDGCFFCTGGAYCKDATQLAVKTYSELKQLLTAKVSKKISQQYEKLMTDCSIAFVYNDHYLKSDAVMCSQVASELANVERTNLQYVFLKGAITNRLVDDLLKSLIKIDNFTFVIEDGSKLFLSEEILDKFQSKGGKFKALRQIKVLAVTVNPTSPDGGMIDENMFYQSLENFYRLDIPIFNVKKQKLDVIE